MSFFTLVVVAAAFAIVVARVSGISSMSTDREVGHVHSTNWIEISNHIVLSNRLLFPLEQSAIPGAADDG